MTNQPGPVTRHARVTGARVRYPTLYQINTRVWLTDLGRQQGRLVTLDDVPDEELDRLAAAGFDWIWLLSVWSTGLAGQRASRTNPAWRREFQETLPDLRDEDIVGSGFAITAYTVHPSLGGDEALARLRTRLHQRGLRLMLDFVANHMALDHPWVESHPEYFVAGTASDLFNAPQNYERIATASGDRILAHGRDPFFPGWIDTLQLDYSNPETQDAMIAELMAIARRCDGVRCDMAMLLLPDVFERTWGCRPAPFWPRAIQQTRAAAPEFCFMAEVYWDLEWTMQQEGFDYAYDKRLYDRLRERHPRPIRDHLRAEPDYQNKLARFLENHDEPRAAASFPRDVHEAAAIITFLTPGLRFFHQGQFDGRTTRISPHLVRAPFEPPDDALQTFYERVLAVLRRSEVRDGQWRLLECRAAWDGNWTVDSFIACVWQDSGGNRLLVATNYASNQAQCYVPLPFADLAGSMVRLDDLMGPARYLRAGDDLVGSGLYLDVAPWAYHVFAVSTV